ncbi:MAG: hypothetical protein PHV32_07265 [Eubacteriales bacterium]|nr:hypothetical protein [Kiritimatiellia bacterium]MDD4494134.1 hypothetical protein [Eubacteriales bacterium]
MLKFIRHRPVGLESRRNRQGYTFLIHWIIGLVLFVLVPIFSSIGYAFSDVSLETGGISTKFTGLKYFKEILLEDPTYLNNVLSSLQQLVYTLPIILIISLQRINIHTHG